MLFSIESPRSFDEVVSALPPLANERGFSVLHQYDFFTILKGKGFPIERNVYVFEICRAPLASKMLTYYPLFSVMMPCRISVYEDNGKTHIATMDMKPIIEDIAGNEELHNEASALYDQLLVMMSSLV